MSLPGNTHGQDVAIKTEPADFSEWEVVGSMIHQKLDDEFHEPIIGASRIQKVKTENVSESWEEGDTQKSKTKDDSGLWEGYVSLKIKSEPGCEVTDRVARHEGGSDPVIKGTNLLNNGKLVDVVRKNDPCEDFGSSHSCKTEALSSDGTADHHVTDGTEDSHVTDGTEDHHVTDGTEDSHVTDGTEDSHVTKDVKPSKEELEHYSSSYMESNQEQHFSEDSSSTIVTSPTAHDDAADADDHLATSSMMTQSSSSFMTEERLSLFVSSRRKPTDTRGRKKKETDPKTMIEIVSADGKSTLYKCRGCHKLFNKRQTLRQHLITHTDRFACMYCQTRCKSKGDLHTHIQTHTKEKPYHCHVCNTNYTRMSILKKHMKTRLHIRASQDRDNFANIARLKEKTGQRRSSGRRDKHNLTEKTDKTFPTGKSGKHSPMEEEVERQLNGCVDSEERDVSCTQCDQVLSSRAELREHAKSHNFQCDVCHKICKTAQLLRVHSRCHNKASSLSCRICSRSFATHHSLKQHLKSHSSTSSSIATHHSLKQHLKSHSSTSSSIATLHSLKQHLKSHSSVSPSGTKTDLTKIKLRLKLILSSEASTNRESKFKCDECDKVFSSSRLLARHQREHDETYVCGVCIKTFPSFTKLKIHLKLHERNLSCEGDSHEEEDVQDVHKLSVVVGDYKCRLCYKNFQSARQLLGHMQDHAPTMLFSGGSLDYSSATSMDTTDRKTTKHKPNTSKLAQTGVSADKDEVDIGQETESGQPSESDDDSILGSQEFYEIINNAVDGSDDNFDEEEMSDSGDELYSSVKSVLENELKSCNGEDVIMHGHADIDIKHKAEFDRHTEADRKIPSFTCKLCTVTFAESGDLHKHMRRHVCEYCNTFYLEREELASHKCQHLQQLLKEMKVEAQRLNIPQQRWKGYLMARSESESEADHYYNSDQDNSPVQPDDPRSLLHTLTHDEIIQANRHVFKRHSYINMSKNIFACTICNKKYARTTTLTRHLKTHVCHFCNTFYEDKSDLLEHKHTYHRHTALITSGGHAYSLASKENREMFKKHSFVDSVTNMFKCLLCSKKFVRRTVLTCHMKTHVCRFCDKFFEDKSDLSLHMTCHQEDGDNEEEDDDEDGIYFDEYDDKKEDVACPSAVGDLDKDVKPMSLIPSSLTESSLPPSRSQPASSSSSDGRLAFIQVGDSISGERLALVQVDGLLGDSGSTERLALVHISGPTDVGQDLAIVQVSGSADEVYEGSQQTSYSPNMPHSEDYSKLKERPLVEASTNSTASDALRVINVKLEEGFETQDDRDSPYECGECGKKFIKKAHLKSHINVHTGDRPFICMLCGKAFGRSTTLRKHIKTHMKQCKVCNKTFTSKAELNVHKIVHLTL